MDKTFERNRMNLSEIEKFATRARRNLTEGADAALTMLGFAGGSQSSATALDAQERVPPAPVAVQGGWIYRGEVVEDADFGLRWKRLKEFIEKEGRKVVVERAAYTWFNRLVAIRILAKRGLVQSQLEWADKAAHVPQIVHRMRTGGWKPNLTPGEDVALAKIRHDPTKTREQFAILVGAFCRETPILKAAFGEIDDWTMLLVPSNLLAVGGLVDDLNNSMLLSDDDYRQDELIGWLYQYYIAERKAEVYDGFKKNKKAGVAEIPAATQIFTPGWIVKYLVENTLNVADESTKFIDPCCGSGHILLEAFRRYVDVYDDLGYSKRDAVESIFAKNITGIDIDPRARQLSTFALLLAAASEDDSFADAHALPKVFDTSSAIISPMTGLAGSVIGETFADSIADNLYTSNKAAICETAAALAKLRERGDTIGSLLKLEISSETRALVETRLADVEDEGLRRALALVLALTAKYDALVTNPPYLGAGNLDVDLKKYLEENYKDGKSDLFAAFILRLLEMCKDGGHVGMITMQSWMFLSSFEALRRKILEEKTILSMLHLGAHAFDSIGGEVTQTTAFVIANECIPDYEATYYRLVDGQNEAEKEAIYKAALTDGAQRLYKAKASNFSKIPGSPIAYWVGEKMIKAFESSYKQVGSLSEAEGKNVTTDNARFIRKHWEVSAAKVGNYNKRWFLCAMGGTYRKWTGNIIDTIDWSSEARLFYKTNPAGRVIKEEFWNLPGVTWGKISSTKPSFRLLKEGEMYQETAILQHNEEDTLFVLALLNATVTDTVLQILSPTINFQQIDICSIPLPIIDKTNVLKVVNDIIALSRADWDEYETSWDFKVNPLVREGWQRNGSAMSLETAWAAVFARRMEWAARMKALEEENNRLFIKAYGLEDELKPDVAWKDVSLTGNPFYRYKIADGIGDNMASANGAHDNMASANVASANGAHDNMASANGARANGAHDNMANANGAGNNGFRDSGASNNDVGNGEACPVSGDTIARVPPALEARSRGDAMRELLSYGMGVLMGRYSLEQEGLILASQGETYQDYLARVHGADRIHPDDDGIIPALALEGNFFVDNLLHRMREFLSVAFGEEALNGNLNFIEEALGCRFDKYLTDKLFDDHVKAYRKRPIYWLFESPKGCFRAFAYMHRMTGATAAVVRSKYLLPYIGHLEKCFAAESAKGAAMNSAERRRVKEIEKAIADCRMYSPVLQDIANQSIAIDLDDGVAVNWEKYKSVLAKI